MRSHAKLLIRALCCLVLMPWHLATALAQGASAPLDIVGIRPGMTPKEVRAALTAYNASLTVEEVNTRLMDPTDRAMARYQRIPHYLVARTVNRSQPDVDNQPDGSAESITVEFTTPPGAPVADRISRWVRFPNGKPLLVKTLLDAMEKKYGPSNGEVSTDKTWAFSAEGKLLTQVPQGARTCWPNLAGFPMFQSGSQGRDSGDISLLNSAPAMNPEDYSAACGQFLFMSGYYLNIGLDKPLQEMRVYLESGPLYVQARAATHQWLQAQADGKNRGEAAADAARAAPKL